MAGFTPQEEAMYRELEERAREQAQALYARRQEAGEATGPAFSPAPPEEREAPPEVLTPAAVLPPQESPRDRQGQAPNFGPRIFFRQKSRPGGSLLSRIFGRGDDGPDREQLLLVLLLYILIREGADKKLILALVYILLF